MSLLPDYSRQALSYDNTRAASPSVLAPLREALRGAPGKHLVDIGGGTGNYAAALRAEGWDPVVIDRSPEMLARARAKGLETIEADAQALPLADESVDAAILVAMLHHVESPALALSEVRRIVRPGGRVAVMVFTWEDVEDLWLLELFPSSREWMCATHQSMAELLEGLPGARRLPFSYTDLEDATVAAMASRPEKILEEGWREQTSFFERMGRDHPEELERGLRTLRAQLDAGRAPTGAGRASVLAWGKD